MPVISPARARPAWKDAEADALYPKAKNIPLLVQSLAKLIQ